MVENETENLDDIFLEQNQMKKLEKLEMRYHAPPASTILSAAVVSKMLGDVSLNNRQDAKKRKSIAALS
jgi:hypothetical protein